MDPCFSCAAVPPPIYLDNAASTAPDPEVMAAVRNAAVETYANSSSAHRPGSAAARALEEAREEVALLLRGAPGEIVFTSGGTEANAIAVLGAAAAARGRHVVASAIEHPAVLRNVERLKAQGFEVTIVPPAKNGTASAAQMAAATRPETSLVALMLVNNELGTLQPIVELTAALRAAGRRAHVHVDAVQAAGVLPVDVRLLQADSLALSGHKLHGPRGVGALWLRRGARVEPLWDGGRQEHGLRSGTENLPGIAGLARAARLVRERAPAAALTALRDDLERRLLEAVPGSRPTVPPGTPRAPHIVSLTLPSLPAEPLLHALEERGVVAAAGSACASRTRGPSHVLRAIGAREDDAVLRFSVARDTPATAPEIAASALRDAVAAILPAVTAARGRAPLRP